MSGCNLIRGGPCKSFYTLMTAGGGLPHRYAVTCHNKVPIRLKRGLGGPEAILFISRYACSDDVAKLFMFLCKSKRQGGVLHHFAELLTSLEKNRAIWGIAAIVWQYRVISGILQSGLV